jgi:DNA polymerase III subunit epsilon
MGWFESLRQAMSGAGPSDPALKARYDGWRKLPEPDLDADHLMTRYVVVDVEASGLDAEHDRLISIGAVAVDRGLIQAGDAFEVVLRQDQVSTNENILIHGIGAAAQREGSDPSEALLAFLEFAGKSPLIAFHAFFDEAMIGRAAREAIGVKPDLLWIDLAWILPDLFPDQHHQVTGLDPWLQTFGIPNFQRHNAVADCYATAQLLQVVLGESRRRAVATPSLLKQLEKSRRWLRPS